MSQGQKGVFLNGRAGNSTEMAEVISEELEPETQDKEGQRKAEGQADQKGETIAQEIKKEKVMIAMEHMKPAKDWIKCTFTRPGICMNCETRIPIGAVGYHDGIKPSIRCVVCQEQAKLNELKAVKKYTQEDWDELQAEADKWSRLYNDAIGRLKELQDIVEELQDIVDKLER